MNNKQKGILLMIPFILVSLILFSIIPEILISFIIVISVAIFGFMAISGIKLLIE